jgi:hypothetical protein
MIGQFYLPSIIFRDFSTQIFQVIFKEMNEKHEKNYNDFKTSFDWLIF